MTRSLAVVVALAVLAPAALVHADSPAEAEAIALFDEGITAMKAGDFDKACKAFERSLALVPDSGTKGSLAKCYERSGKLASSWLMWRELADTAGTPELRKSAAENAHRLDDRLPRYQLHVATPTPGIAITVNGKPVDSTLDLAIPVDAGTLTIAATAPDFQPWHGEAVAVEGQTVPVEVPPLVPAPPVVHVVDPPPPPPPHDVVVVTGVGPRHRRRVLGFTAIAVGGGAIVVGSVFGVISRSAFADANTLCGGDVDHCPANELAAAQQKVDDSRSAGNLSTGLFVAGGVAAAVGVILVVTAPKLVTEHRVTIAPMVTGDGAGVSMFGRF